MTSADEVLPAGESLVSSERSAAGGQRPEPCGCCPSGANTNSHLACWWSVNQCSGFIDGSVHDRLQTQLARNQRAVCRLPVLSPPGRQQVRVDRWLLTLEVPPFRGVKVDVDITRWSMKLARGTAPWPRIMFICLTVSRSVRSERGRLSRSVWYVSVW